MSVENEASNDTEQTQNEAPTETDVAEPESAKKLISFEDLGLNQEILDAVKAMGFEHPTEVQAETVPHAMAGKDVVVQSRTGTGKTAAFGLPMIQKLVDPEKKVVQALALAPTRELAIQVAAEIKRLAANVDIDVVPVYGGAAMGPQITALNNGGQVVVGTPGRVLDHMRRRNLKTDGIRLLVLDEGDEMLSMGFAEEINAIIDRLPKERQSMVFSATIPDEIKGIVKRHLTDPVRLMLSEDFVGVREIDHVYYLVSGGDRANDLLKVIEYEQPEKALVFCNTRDHTAMVAGFLKKKGFAAEGISSDLSQADRERVMGKMRKGEIRFLTATDVAARGIDLSDLSHVFNFTFPESADVYVHRTGRTGRAGKSGVAISLVSPQEIGSFYYLKLIHKIFPEERHLPTAEEMASRREAARLERLQGLFESRQTTEELRSLARRLNSTLDGERLVALALAAVLDEYDQVYAQVRRVAPIKKAPEPRSGGSDDGDGRRPPARPKRERTRGRDDRSSRRRDGRSDNGRRGGRNGGRGPARKTTRSAPRSAPSHSGSFTTPDGDVEQWESVDGDRGRREQPLADQIRLYFNVGRRQGLRPADLVRHIHDNVETEAEALGRITIRDTHTFLAIAGQIADQVVTSLDGTTLLDKELRVERAKK